MPPRYLWVKNWRTHQHYHDRRPPWIKFYTSLLVDGGFRALPTEQKAMLPLLWIVAADDNGKITFEPDALALMIGMPGPLNLEPLIQAGFLLTTEPASTPVLARRASTRRGEKSREEKRTADQSAKPETTLTPEQRRQIIADSLGPKDTP